MDFLGIGVKRCLYKGTDIFSKNHTVLSTIPGVFGCIQTLVCVQSVIIGTCFLVGDPGVGKVKENILWRLGLKVYVGVFCEVSREG